VKQQLEHEKMSRLLIFDQFYKKYPENPATLVQG